MRTAARWVVLVLLVATCLAAAYAAYTLAGYSWDQVAEYETPYAALKLPSATAGPASGRVVIVIVDGLTEEASRRMGTLNALRGYGSDLTVSVAQPSISYPDWTTILSGAPPDISGVTSNGWEGRVPVETLLDTVVAAGRRSIVVGPRSLDELYGAGRATRSYFRDWREGDYLAAEFVDKAVEFSREVTPALTVVHIEEVDEAGHDAGSSSAAYAEAVARVDFDLGRLVGSLQGRDVTFAILSDHGHIASGGHGGPEPIVSRAPAVISGAGVVAGRGEARQTDVAPTLAAIAGIPSPRFATGEALASVLGTSSPAVFRPQWAQRSRFARAYAGLVLEPTGRPVPPLAQDAHGARVTAYMRQADAARLRYDRRERLLPALAVAAGALLALALVALGSWRAWTAAMFGSLLYHAVYNGLYFGVHGYGWSLSDFNEESRVQSFLYSRMAEAGLAVLLACLAAALVYAALRREPKRPRGEYLPGWLALGPATCLAVLATLAFQVAWFLWWWGAQVVWRLPDLRWALKYDLDLTQAAAVGAFALVAPVVTYLAGKYHPKVRRPAHGSEE